MEMTSWDTIETKIAIIYLEIQPFLDDYLGYRSWPLLVNHVSTMDWSVQWMTSYYSVETKNAIIHPKMWSFLAHYLRIRCLSLSRLTCEVARLKNGKKNYCSKEKKMDEFHSNFDVKLYECYICIIDLNASHISYF